MSSAVVRRIVDVRLVLDRDGAIRVSIDGRAVEIPSTDDASVALFELARRLDALAWSTKRSALELLTEARSALFAGSTERAPAPMQAQDATAMLARVTRSCKHGVQKGCLHGHQEDENEDGDRS